MSNQYSAAHINAIAEEGTKSEAIEWLQKHWNSLQDAKAEITRLRAALERIARGEANEITIARAALANK